MSAAQLGSDQIRNYLLRRMSDEERAAFESAYFADDRLLDRVEEEEDGLVSDYVLGRLPETDRKRFEESLLGTPYYRERVETTSRLRQRIAQHRAFDRRGKGTPAPRPLPSRRAGDEGGKGEGRLFPGGTGTVIAFAFLGVLLVAAILSALTLRRELAAARAAASSVPLPAPRASASPAAGVVPSAQSVVLTPGEIPGPRLRRLARPPGSALLVVVPSAIVSPDAHAFELAILSPQGASEWRSARLPVARAAGPPDLALRLPAGIPPDGRSSVTLRTFGPGGERALSLGILEITTAAR